MRRSLARVATETRTCHTCDQQTDQEILESVRRGTLLGISLGVKSRRRYAVCPRCGSREFLPEPDSSG